MTLFQLTNHLLVKLWALIPLGVGRQYSILFIIGQLVLVLPFAIAAAYFAAHPVYRFHFTFLQGYHLVEPYHLNPVVMLLLFGIVTLLIKRWIHNVVLQFNGYLRLAVNTVLHLALLGVNYIFLLPFFVVLKQIVTPFQIFNKVTLAFSNLVFSNQWLLITYQGSLFEKNLAIEAALTAWPASHVLALKLRLTALLAVESYQGATVLLRAFKQAKDALLLTAVAASSSSCYPTGSDILLWVGGGLLVSSALISVFFFLGFGGSASAATAATAAVQLAASGLSSSGSSSSLVLEPEVLSPVVVAGVAVCTALVVYHPPGTGLVVYDPIYVGESVWNNGILHGGVDAKELILHVEEVFAGGRQTLDAYRFTDEVKFYCYKYGVKRLTQRLHNRHVAVQQLPEAQRVAVMQEELLAAHMDLSTILHNIIFA